MTRLSRGADPYLPVVGAVVADSGKVLLCQRHDGPHLPLLWEFPGGKIESGESPEQALARELNEELGCDASVGTLVAEVFHTYPEKRVWLRFYRASLHADPEPRVHRSLRWVDPQALGRYSVPPPNAVVVAKILSGELAVH